jgi:hypothetical protein
MGRPSVWNFCRGNHLGQRSCASAQTGRTYGRKRSDQSTAHTLRGGGRPHTENQALVLPTHRHAHCAAHASHCAKWASGTVEPFPFKPPKAWENRQSQNGSNAVGPITVFDKSFLQSLTVDESVWFDRFFVGVVCPIFYVETLADLSKKTARRSNGRS